MDLIDRKALLKDVSKIGGSPWSEWETAGVFNVIRKQPVLTLDDLRPRGRWVMRGGKRYCSHCGERACVTRDREDFWYTVGTKFYPECGAIMDKEADQ